MTGARSSVFALVSQHFEGRLLVCFGQSRFRAKRLDRDRRLRGNDLLALKNGAEFDER
ncbi:hypothetical protein [Streptomyces tibetensis]|uniref:hypothetical protein n=1 Tax=Streptomyces tibetensis TaxID=2382123 RepID=UPI0034035B88